MIKKFLPALIVAVFLPMHIQLIAQDTVSVNLAEFIQRGLEKSGQVAYQQRAVDLAENRVDQAESQRILPRVSLNTQHGIVPGVDSPLGLPDGQLYLDPNLENDWENWAIFTRAELSAVQPIFSWGAINKAIQAAEAGAKAAEYRFNASRSEVELQLFDLYYSYLLVKEIEVILADASGQIDRVEDQIEKMREEGNPDLEESDVFKFEIYRSEFEVRVKEVEESSARVKRIWEYILGGESNQTFEPAQQFLDPVPYEIESFDYYQQLALSERSELIGVEYGIDALKKTTEAVRSQQFPLLFMGISGSYANTPNRPRQTNPFIINSTNYASAAIGFGIRQNLSFGSMKAAAEKADIEYRRVQDLKSALTDGIILELNDSYQEAVVADEKVKRTEEALVTARNWVRNEQLNYDIGFGDVENLLEAVQKELELRVELKQNVYNFNKRVAALYKSAGIPIYQLSTN
ncbi:MAG: TolC family protein [Balneolaceae bacterium]|nr:TolC family protein [Balneolaceae bacterium]